MGEWASMLGVWLGSEGRPSNGSSEVSSVATSIGLDMLMCLVGYLVRMELKGKFMQSVVSTLVWYFLRWTVEH